MATADRLLAFVPAARGFWLTTVDGQAVLVGPRDKRQLSKDMRWTCASRSMKRKR
jgi:hypothetical protein